MYARLQVSYFIFLMIQHKKSISVNFLKMNIKKVTVRAKWNIIVWSKTEHWILVFCISLAMHFTENLQEYFLVRNQILFRKVP